MVIARLRTFLADRGAILDAIGKAVDGKIQRGPLIARSQELAQALGGQEPQATKALVDALVRRVEVHLDCAKIEISLTRLVVLLASHTIDLPAADQPRTDADDTVLTLTASIQLRRIGREMKLLVEGDQEKSRLDMSLLKILARAHDVQIRMNQNPALGVRDIAREDGVTPAYIYILLRLPMLAPDIVTAIVDGRQPIDLNTRKLIRLTAHLPADWDEQSDLLGF